CHASAALLPFLFFFTPSASPDISTLSLHDALPISIWARPLLRRGVDARCEFRHDGDAAADWPNHVVREAPYLEWRYCDAPFEVRSEEHTSELQSRSDLVCRLLLEKKKKKQGHRDEC